MHRIDNNASCAFRVLGFAALSAVVVLAVTSSPALADDEHHHHRHHTNFAFVTASAESALFMIDTTTNKAVAQIPKDGPLQTVVSPDGHTTYSVDTSKNEVLMFDGDKDDPDRICVEEGPFGLALSSDGKKLYVFSTSAEGNTVSVIDTSEEAVEEVDPAPPYKFAIHVSPDGHLSAVN